MSTNIYSHIPIIKSPEELEKVLPGLREFVENYEPNPNDPPSAGWGGYNPKWHTSEMYARQSVRQRGCKRPEHSKKMMGHKSYETQIQATILSNQTRIVSDETKKKISESHKKRHAKARQERSTIIRVENESMY
jgi:hypothetical protein